MNPEPKSEAVTVTVAIPTRDPNLSFLGAAVDSVLAQTRPVDRIVVVDNSQKAPGAVRELCESYGKGTVDYLPPVRNLSMGENHQRALSEARSTFACVMQDDDVHLPTFVERALSAFHDHPDAGVFAVNYSVIDESGAILRPCAWLDFRSGVLSPTEFLSYAIEFMSPVHLSASMFRRDAATNTSFWEVDATCFDIGFFLRLACAGPVILVDEPLASVRQHTRSSSFSQGWYGRSNSITVSVLPIEWRTKSRFLRSGSAAQALGDDLEPLRKRATKRIMDRYIGVILGRGYSMKERMACVRNAFDMKTARYTKSQ